MGLSFRIQLDTNWKFVFVVAGNVFSSSTSKGYRYMFSRNHAIKPVYPVGEFPYHIFDTIRHGLTGNGSSCQGIDVLVLVFAAYGINNSLG